jgi:Rod binding domain-containing protein
MDGINPIVDSGLRIADSGRVQDPQLESVKRQSSRPQRGEDEKKQIAKDFESVLLTKLFDEVKESIGQWNLDEDGEDGASQQVHGLFWLYLAQDVADKGGFGVWQEIYRNFEDMEGARGAGALIDREL